MIRVSDIMEKEIINVKNGKRMGFITDIDMDINEGKVIHDGIKYPVYLYQIDEKIEIDKDFTNHPNSAFGVGMEFRTKRELKLKLIDVINE